MSLIQRIKAEITPKSHYDQLIGLSAPLRALGYDCLYLYKNDVFLVSSNDSDIGFIVQIKERPEGMYVELTSATNVERGNPSTSVRAKPVRISIEDENNLTEVHAKIISHIRNVDEAKTTTSKTGLLKVLRRRFPNLEASYQKTFDGGKLLHLYPKCARDHYDIALVHIASKDRWQLLVSSSPSVQDNVYKHAISTIRATLAQGLTTPTLLGDVGDRLSRLMVQAYLASKVSRQ